MNFANYDMSFVNQIWTGETWQPLKIANLCLELKRFQNFHLFSKLIGRI